jgi:rod shape-determining protein MreC
MKRYNYKRYLVILGILFLLVSLPSFFVEGLRGAMIGSFYKLFHWVSPRGGKQTVEMNRLEGENHLLRVEVSKMRSLLEQREKTVALRQELQKPGLSPRRCDEIGYLSTLCHQAIPARVIYRDPGSWSSTLWVGVGEETNRVLKYPVIQKNSPVILGRSVVGTVDYVGKKQSRIRLITDVALSPSVRAVRGFQQNVCLTESVDAVLRHLNTRKEIGITPQERLSLKNSLEAFKVRISGEIEGWHLAKGVLQGAATPFCRSVNHTLRGVGFNYDFPDAEGPAREIATGKVIGEEGGAPIPIIKLGDLLVTTGMDGVFPPGLRVAEVTKIFPLREGAYTYEIEAVPVVGNLDALQTVFIIPPVGYKLEE